MKPALFSVPEYVKEQEWLSRQHRNGWKLMKIIPPCFYVFERCKPEEVVYQLDYNQEGMAHTEEYVQMFQDLGWEHILDFVGYSYFRKPVAEMEDQEEIFSDDASKLEMAERIFKGKIFPLLVLFFLVIIPLLFQLHDGGTDFQKFVYGFFVGLFIVYLSLFIQYGIQYFALKKKVGK